MVSTPNFEQLKEACGSNEIRHCFQFLCLQEEGDNERLITHLTGICDDIRRKIAKRRELYEEGLSFSPSRVTADGLHCMEEDQCNDGRILAALVTAVDLAREARVHKRRHVATMNQHD